MSKLSKETTRVLKEAKAASTHLQKLHSPSLGSVRDGYTGQEIMPWRNNGKAPNHPLHSMMPRVGGFPPALARYFIAAYSEPGEVVLDPFCGKGTTLLEAVSLGRRAIGGDIAPDSVVSSAAKCAKVSASQVVDYIAELPTGKRVKTDSVPENVKVFFEEDTLRQILAIRRYLLADMTKGSRSKKNVATFVMGVLLGLLHGHSEQSLSLPCNQCFAMAPNYVKKYAKEHSLKKPRRNVKECLQTKSQFLLPGPKRSVKATVYLASADRCNRYVARSKCKANLILTSPPYLNRQTYLKDAWLRLWLLGHDRQELMPKSFETGNVPAFLDAMERSLRAMWNSLLPGGVAVLVCGSAKVTVGKRKRRVHVQELCTLAAKNCTEEKTPFSVERLITDRVLLKRGSYFAVHHGNAKNGKGSVGKRYGEDEILVLRKKD